VGTTGGDGEREEAAGTEPELSVTSGGVDVAGGGVTMEGEPVSMGVFGETEPVIIGGGFTVPESVVAVNGGGLGNVTEELALAALEDGITGGESETVLILAMEEPDEDDPDGEEVEVTESG